MSHSHQPGPALSGPPPAPGLPAGRAPAVTGARGPVAPGAGTAVPAFELDARAEAVPGARAAVRELLDDWHLDAPRDDVDLVLTELLGNVVLHAPGPARVAVRPHPDGVRLEVRDTSTTRPLRRVSGAGATTGRGLNLVAALCTGWGVEDRSDAEPGKVVWCVVPRVPREPVVPDLDVDALLAAFDDEEGDEPGLVHVEVGEAPVALLRATKDQLDGLLRELVLSDGGRLPAELLEPMVLAVRNFAQAREQLQVQLSAALAAGAGRVRLVFRLPVGLADHGERYLAALRRADVFARDRRMLSLAAPVQHRVLREWYVEGLVRGLRRAAAGRPPTPWESFEDRLLRELHLLDEAARTASLAADLQGVTARLAGADEVREIAAVALTEGVRALGAAGGMLARNVAGSTVEITSTGADRDLSRRYRGVPGARGPSHDALQTGRPVYVESRHERDARYPHLARVQPTAAAVAALPLLVAGQVVGALRLSWSEPRLFTDPEREFMQCLAAQAALALARTDALEQLRALRGELEDLRGTPGAATRPAGPRGGA